jgi:hypothetical protein
MPKLTLNKLPNMVMKKPKIIVKKGIVRSIETKKPDIEPVENTEDIDIEFDCDSPTEELDNSNVEDAEDVDNSNVEDAEDVDNSNVEDIDNMNDIDKLLLKKRDDNIETTPKNTPKIKSKKISSSIPLIRNKLKGLEYVDPDNNVSDVDDVDLESDKKSNKKLKKTSISQPRRGPGRPCKAPKKDPIPRKGIVKAPLNSDDHIEFIYDQPLLLRKIFQLFKQLAVAQVQIIFRPSEILFYSQDHHKKTDCRIKIDTKKINLYYCRSELEVGVSAKDIECILNTVDKEYSSIIITSNINSTQKNITINLENSLQADEIHTIELVGSYKHMENEHEFLDHDYAIELKFPWHFFKKTTGDIKSMTSQISITQIDKTKPLLFEFLKANKKVSTKHVYKNSSKIELKSKVKEDAGFRVDVKIDYLKPIASAQIADNIAILVDENKKIMTCAYLDNHTIEIRTLTEIIDDRPED